MSTSLSFHVFSTDSDMYFSNIIQIIFFLHFWNTFKFEILIEIALKVKWSESHSVMSDSLRPHGLYIVHGILQTRILEGIAFPFSRGYSQPRGWTQVSCIAGRFFTSWATGEFQKAGLSGKWIIFMRISLFFETWLHSICSDFVICPSIWFHNFIQRTLPLWLLF